MRLMMALFAKPKIRPAVEQSTQPSGLPIFTWLNRLKNSARNCALNCSLMGKFLIKLASVWNHFGPVNELRTAFPNVPTCGRLHGPLVAPLVDRGCVAIAYQ